MTLFKNEACFYFFVGKTRRSDALIAFVKSHLTFEYKRYIKHSTGTLQWTQARNSKKRREINEIVFILAADQKGE